MKGKQKSATYITIHIQFQKMHISLLDTVDQWLPGGGFVGRKDMEKGWI